MWAYPADFKLVLSKPLMPIARAKVLVNRSICDPDLHVTIQRVVDDEKGANCGRCSCACLDVCLVYMLSRHVGLRLWVEVYLTNL